MQLTGNHGCSQMHHPDGLNRQHSDVRPRSNNNARGELRFRKEATGGDRTTSATCWVCATTCCHVVALTLPLKTSASQQERKIATPASSHLHVRRSLNLRLDGAGDKDGWAMLVILVSAYIGDTVATLDGQVHGMILDRFLALVRIVQKDGASQGKTGC